MDTQDLIELRRAAEDIFPRAVRTRHELHRRPELSFRETQTTAFIAGELAAGGISFTLLSERIPGATGLVAEIPGKMPVPPGGGRPRVFALRADMDALPLTEDSGENFSSERTGVMHACGHDLHTAILLASALVLKRLENRFSGTVKLVFQPAEEVGQGADLVLRSGLISDTDGMAAIHMDPAVPAGRFTLGYGSRTAEGYSVKIRVRAGVNPDDAIREMAFLVNTIGAEFPGECLSGHAVFTPTLLETMEEGTVSAVFDGRLTDEGDRAKIRDFVCRMTAAAEAVFGLPAEVSWQEIRGTVVNDRASADLAAEVIRAVLGEDFVQEGPPAMFGEDFRRYREITGNQVFALLGGAGNFTRYSLHNSRVRFDDRALLSGILYEAGFALEYLARGQYQKKGEA